MYSKGSDHNIVKGAPILSILLRSGGQHAAESRLGMGESVALLYSTGRVLVCRVSKALFKKLLKIAFRLKHKDVWEKAPRNPANPAPWPFERPGYFVECGVLRGQQRGRAMERMREAFDQANRE